MKKTYIAPVSQTLELECDGMLALSCTEGEQGKLTNENFNETTGDYEYCSTKMDMWKTEW